MPSSAMPRDRKGGQLAVELPPELLQQLKAHAAATDRPMAALVRRWIEAGLAGALDPTGSAAPAGTDLAARLAAVELSLIHI